MIVEALGTRLAGPAAVPRVAFVPEPGSYEIASEEAIQAVAVRADAYAGDVDALAAAVAWLADGVHAPAGLALRYLGSLGERRPSTAPRIGEVLPLAATLEIGRSVECAIVLRQGAHSDQNRVARRHAQIVPDGDGACVIDRGSTNGTWVRGERVHEARAGIGDEIAIASTHRFVLVGPR